MAFFSSDELYFILRHLVNEIQFESIKDLKSERGRKSRDMRVNSYAKVGQEILSNHGGLMYQDDYEYFYWFFENNLRR